MVSVSATDANDTAIATTEDSLEINQATDDVIGMEEDKELASSGTNEVLKADEQTFSQLNATINGNTDNNIYLTSDISIPVVMTVLKRVLSLTVT